MAEARSRTACVAAVLLAFFDQEATGLRAFAGSSIGIGSGSGSTRSSSSSSGIRRRFRVEDQPTRAPSESCVTQHRRVNPCREIPTCKLERLPRRTLERVVPLRPTASKWLAHHGQTPAERQGKLVESLGTAFVAYWTTFFASRALGPFAFRAYCIVALLQTLVWPLVQSYKRSVEVWGEGGRRGRRKTKGALFTGRVTRTGFAMASEASEHRTHFQMLVEDDEGRELFFDVPQVRDYRRVRRGLRCDVIVLSRSTGFSKLTGVTEAYLPEVDLFVGRYPLLDKSAFWEILYKRDERDMRDLSEATGSAMESRRPAVRKASDSSPRLSEAKRRRISHQRSERDHHDATARHRSSGKFAERSRGAPEAVTWVESEREAFR